MRNAPIKTNLGHLYYKFVHVTSWSTQMAPPRSHGQTILFDVAAESKLAHPVTLEVRIVNEFYNAKLIVRSCLSPFCLYRREKLIVRGRAKLFSTALLSWNTRRFRESLSCKRRLGSAACELVSKYRTQMGFCLSAKTTPPVSCTKPAISRLRFLFRWRVSLTQRTAELYF